MEEDFGQAFFAYLDPGTGGFLLQMLIAAGVGGLFAIKRFWTGFKAFFFRLCSRLKTRESKAEE